MKSNGGKGLYEIHITLSQHAELQGWKASAIDGDPVLGDGVKHYLTTYGDTIQECFGKIDRAIDALREVDRHGLVLRAKVELTLYDSLYKDGKEVDDD